MELRPALAPRAAALLAALATAALAAAPVARAHGTAEFPKSRIYQCRFAESPENPRSEGCRAFRERGGSGSVYDWNEVNLPDANGRAEDVIPDGELCSAGREKYRGLDLPLEWPRTELPSGRRVTFRYRASAPHSPSYFDVYVTRDGFDPSRRLRFSDLEKVTRVENPRLVGESYEFDVTLPRRRRGSPGIVYQVWQRVRGSGEAFFSCSDVRFR